MSEIGLSYDAKSQPSDVNVRFGLSFANTTLRATVGEVAPFIITLTPTGNVGEQIVSGVAWPLAQFLGTVLPPMATSLMNGFAFDVLGVSETSVTIEGETFSVKPANLSLSSHNGMLLVQGSLQVS